MITRLRLLLAILAVVAVAVACGDDDNATNTPAGSTSQSNTPVGSLSGEPITIGLVTALSGETAEIGTQLQKAAQFAVDRINANGGVNGSPLKLVVEDSQGIPENATAAFTRLVSEEHAVAVIGALTSPPTLAMAQQAERVEVPVIVDTAAGEALVNSGLKYLVRLSQGAKQEADGQVGVLPTLSTALNKPIKKVSFLGWDGTSFVDDELQEVNDIAAANNITVGEVVRFTEGQTSYASEVARIKADNPDAVIWCVLGIPEAVAIAREYKQQGMDTLKTPLINCSVSVTDPTFVDNAGDLAEGIYTIQGWFKGLAGANTALWDDFKAETGMEVYDLPALEVQSVYVAKAAMEKCSCTDPKKINDALHTLTIEADDPNYVLQPGTGVEFDERGVNKRVLVGVYQWQHATLVPIWPENIKGGEPEVSTQ